MPWNMPLAAATGIRGSAPRQPLVDIVAHVELRGPLRGTTALPPYHNSSDTLELTPTAALVASRTTPFATVQIAPTFIDDARRARESWCRR